jgi:hypothetical protein
MRDLANSPARAITSATSRRCCRPRWRPCRIERGSRNSAPTAKLPRAPPGPGPAPARAVTPAAKRLHSGDVTPAGDWRPRRCSAEDLAYGTMRRIIRLWPRIRPSELCGFFSDSCAASAQVSNFISTHLPCAIECQSVPRSATRPNSELSWRQNATIAWVDPAAGHIGLHGDRDRPDGKGQAPWPPPSSSSGNGYAAAPRGHTQDMSLPRQHEQPCSEYRRLAVSITWVGGLSL